ncbi:hypothetical protein ATANTOWER_014804 [Ataeniobius toweri]|uniref:Secreted protein n=1 Tax=Ataeniobius toweri TaxID=208326 RepID=A0ABU7A6D8_9TELE|nr:hypothetical protein [Ataeniobius toweri]
MQHINFWMTFYFIEIHLYFISVTMSLLSKCFCLSLTSRYCKPSSSRLGGGSHTQAEGIPGFFMAQSSLALHSSFTSPQGVQRVGMTRLCTRPPLLVTGHYSCI